MRGLGSSSSEFFMVNLRVRMKMKYLKSLFMKFSSMLEDIFKAGDEIGDLNDRKKEHK